jgi:hypothetical protein
VVLCESERRKTRTQGSRSDINMISLSRNIRHEFKTSLMEKHRVHIREKNRVCVRESKSQQSCTDQQF